ncbi:MAG: rubredoxin [Patescibacteria group bacterium]
MDNKNKKEVKFNRYICLACGYIFDEELGDEKNKIPPKTFLKDMPENWHCPDCGAGKDAFELIDFE